MPTSYVHGALIDLYYAGDGAPWIWSQWQRHTGVALAVGSSDVPSSTTWGQEQKAQVASYFEQYRAKPDAAAKRAFSTISASMVPGAELWRRFILEGWKKWQIHDIITRVLIETRFHPCILMQYSSRPGVWPDADDFIPQVMDDVAIELFGDEALDGLGRLQDRFHSSVKVLIQRTWIDIYNKYTKAKANVKACEEEVAEILETISEGSPEPDAVRDIIAKISKWKSMCEVLQSKSANLRLQDAEARLRDVVNHFSGAVSSAHPPSGASIPAINTVQDTSPTGNSDDLLLMFRDFTETMLIEDAVSLEAQHPVIEVDFTDQSSPCDPGMELEHRMDALSLHRWLAHSGEGINKLPQFFVPYRHSACITPHDPGYAHLFDKEHAAANPDMSPFTLHWHQVAGIHSIIRSVFYPSPDPNNVPGILVADDVGLGKTCQSIGAILFLATAVLRRKKKTADAPILRTRPYLGQTKDIPDLPTLVVVPGSVLAQWAVEFRQSVSPEAFDVFTYGTSHESRKHFWAPDGPFCRSTKHLCRRIVIATHSSLTHEFNLLYASSKKKNDQGNRMPWDTERTLPGFQKNVKITLYGQKYLTVVLDEAHEFRNLGPRHTAALAILKQSAVRLIMTATPLQTSTRDISAMGRLVGIPHFMTAASLQADKADLAEIKKVQKSLGPDYDPLSSEDDPQRQVSSRIAQEKRKYFRGHILRRTLDSVDNENKCLINIPPYKTIVVPLKLQERETAILDQLHLQSKESISQSNSMHAIPNSKFYLPYRMGACCPRLNLKDPIPVFRSKDVWDAGKFTKFDICAKLVKHLLSRDDAPEIVVQNGGVKFPRLTAEEKAQPATRNRKVLIYQEFTCLGPLLRNVLKLYGITSVHIDGDTTLDDRTKRVHAFQTNPAVRVFIFSRIGASGINLAMADVIIYVDQTWSGQEMRQARGRAHRQPQKNVVRCYHLLAENTADIILYGLALGKQDMMTAFLTKETGKDMFALLTGHTIDQDDLTVAERRAAGKQKAIAHNADVELGASSTPLELTAKGRVVASEDDQPLPQPRPSPSHGDDDEYQPSSREPSPLPKKPKKNTRKPKATDKGLNLSSQASQITPALDVRANSRISPAPCTELPSAKATGKGPSLSSQSSQITPALDVVNVRATSRIPPASSTELPSTKQDTSTSTSLSPAELRDMREKVKAAAERVTLRLQKKQERREARSKELMLNTGVNDKAVSENLIEGSETGMSNNMDVDEPECNSEQILFHDNEAEKEADTEGTAEDPLLLNGSDVEVDQYLSQEGDSMHVDSEDSANEGEHQPPQDQAVSMGAQPMESVEQRQEKLWKTPRTPKTGQRRARNQVSGHSPVIERKRQRRTYVVARDCSSKEAASASAWPSLESPLTEVSGSQEQHQKTKEPSSIVPQFKAILQLGNDTTNNEVPASSHPHCSRPSGPPPINFGTKPTRAKTLSTQPSVLPAPAMPGPTLEHGTRLQAAFELQPAAATEPPVALAATMHRPSTDRETRLRPAFELQGPREAQMKEIRASPSRFKPFFRESRLVKRQPSLSPIRSPARELPVATPSPMQPSLTKQPVAVDVTLSKELGGESILSELPVAIPTVNRRQQVSRTYLDRPKLAKGPESLVDDSGLFTDPESGGDDDLVLNGPQTASTPNLSAGPSVLASSATVKRSASRTLAGHEQVASLLYQSPGTSSQPASRPRLRRVPQDGHESPEMSPPREKTTSENPYKATARKKKSNQQ